jgi:hypothetical protein
MMNIRRIAGRMLRQKRKPGRKVKVMERAVEKVIVFEPWVKDINEYMNHDDTVDYNRWLRIKYNEKKK